MEYAVRALRDKGACLQAKESLALAGQALFSVIIPLLDNAIVVIVVNQAEVRFVRNPMKSNSSTMGGYATLAS